MLVAVISDIHGNLPALEKAVSVAGTMLITECVITELPEETDEVSPGQFGMMQ